VEALLDITWRMVDAEDSRREGVNVLGTLSLGLSGGGDGVENPAPPPRNGRGYVFRGSRR
jgi:hypothetical protein